MTSNLELYGREDVPKIPSHVCNFRIQILKERMRVLFNVHYSEWEHEKINNVYKAISFWEKMRDGEENGQ